MFFIGIDTQYASEAESEGDAIKEAAVYFAEQLQQFLSEFPVSDLVFTTEEET